MKWVRENIEQERFQTKYHDYQESKDISISEWVTRHLSNNKGWTSKISRCTQQIKLYYSHN
jgi:hypothetical protein